MKVIGDRRPKSARMGFYESKKQTAESGLARIGQPERKPRSRSSSNGRRWRWGRIRRIRFGRRRRMGRFFRRFVRDGGWRSFRRSRRPFGRLWSTATPWLVMSAVIAFYVLGLQGVIGGRNSRPAEGTEWSVLHEGRGGNGRETVTQVAVLAAALCGIRPSPPERDASYPARRPASRLSKLRSL